MDRVVLPKAEKKEVRAPDKQVLSQLLGAVSGTNLFPLFVMAASTGCRRGELLALEWPDIDLQTGMISISKSLEQTKSGLRVKSTKSGKRPTFSPSSRRAWCSRRASPKSTVAKIDQAGIQRSRPHFLQS
jgi:integrase